jgi:hypothetical protein
MFLVLAMALKVLLLTRLPKHLFETHYRFGGTEENWVNYAAFLAFVALGAACMTKLGLACQKHGVRAVRFANFMIVSSGLLLILLTRHTGDKNYLYPVMTGVLPASSLWPYLSLDFFFRGPFLGAWILGYVLTYYFLIRTEKEGFVIYVSALCAAIFSICFLRELTVYRNELLVIDALAFTCLLLGGRYETWKRLLWVALPFLGILVSWLLFREGSSELRELHPYFSMIIASVAVLAVGSTLLAWNRGFGPEWTGFLPFFVPAFLLLANTNYPNATNYNNLLCLGVSFPRYFLGEISIAAGLACLAALYSRWRPRGSFLWLDATIILFLLLTLLDLKLLGITGVRLDADVVSFGNDPKMMLRVAQPYLPGAVLGLLVLVTLYAVPLALWFRRRKPRLDLPKTHLLTWDKVLLAPSLYAVALGITGLGVASVDKARGQAVIRLAASSPILRSASRRPMAPAEFTEASHRFGLPFGANRMTAVPPVPRDLNVVLVFMESTYNQHLSLFNGKEETQPELSRYKERMELFPNFFSSYAGSIHARFAAFTGLYPIRNYNAFTLERVPVKSIFEVLHESGYACSMFYSSSYDYTGFRDFLKDRGLDEMYDADSMPGARQAPRLAWGLREDEVLGAIREKIKKHADEQRRFFLTYVPAAPHYPYDNIPRQFQKFRPGAVGDYTPFYLNDLLFMDWVIASIIDQLRDSKLLDQTLVIITNDHGEMLGVDGGSIGHGWKLTPDLANSPLIIMDPTRPGNRLNYAVGSTVDLLPTILGRLGIQLPSGQLYQGMSLDSSADAKRLIFLNSYQQYGMIEGGRLWFGDRLLPGSHASCFALSNQNNRTIFQECESPERMPVDFSAYDAFQENFLKNYSHYCKVLAPVRAEVARSR